MKKILIPCFVLIALFPNGVLFAQNSNLLSPEESLWLQTRNNTIIVYPERNNPPFSYQSPGGNIQGLAIDFIELVAEKIGAKIEYLNPQSRNQIIDELKIGKGDIAISLTEAGQRTSDFIFTENFITVPTVIVVRRDRPGDEVLSPADFNGKRVSVVNGSALEEYLRENYPRIVIEDVTDDEVGLQQIILAEVEAGMMDIASLSFYLSKQVLNSVKIAGNTGMDYKPAFALAKDKAVLQSILEKGMSQIAQSDRELLNEKWITLPEEKKDPESLLAKIMQGFYSDGVYILLGLCVLGIAIIISRISRPFGFSKRRNISELKEEVYELERMNDELSKEMNVIKAEEDRLQQKIETLEKS